MRVRRTTCCASRAAKRRNESDRNPLSRRSAGEREPSGRSNRRGKARCIASELAGGKRQTKNTSEMDSKIIKPVFKSRNFALHGVHKRPRDEAGSHVARTPPAEMMNKKQASEQAEKKNDLDLSIYDVDLNWIDSGHAEDEANLSELETSAHDSGPHATIQDAAPKDGQVQGNSLDAIDEAKSIREDPSQDETGSKPLCVSEVDCGEREDHARRIVQRDETSKRTSPGSPKVASPPKEMEDNRIQEVRDTRTNDNACFGSADQTSECNKSNQETATEALKTAPIGSKDEGNAYKLQNATLATEMDCAYSEVEDPEPCNAADEQGPVKMHDDKPSTSASPKADGYATKAMTCCDSRQRKTQDLIQEEKNALLPDSQHHSHAKAISPTMPCVETLHNANVSSPTQPDTPEKDTTHSMARVLYSARNKLKAMGQEISAMNEELSDLQIEYAILHNRSLMLWNVDLQAKFQTMLEMADKTRTLLEHTDS